MPVYSVTQKSDGVEVPGHALPRARMWLMDQVGRPYDWTAIVGFVFRQRRWQSETAWFSRHPERDDAVAVEADPREVQRWIRDADHALLDEAADAVKDGAAVTHNPY